MRMTKRSAAMVVALVSGAGLMAAMPAEAAASDCPSGYVCVWNDLNYGPQNTMVKKLMVSTTYWDLPSGPQDEVSSWYNKTNTRKCLLDYWNGTTYTLGVLSANTGKSYVGDSVNDRADAVEYC